MSESNELVVVEPVNIPALFEEDGSDPIIEGLKRKAAEFEGDVTTAKGRKEIASFAAKFSTAKTQLDGFGKTLSDEYRAKIAPINVERNKLKACCDESRDKVRKPLTDYEDAEKKRVADIEDRIGFFQKFMDINYLYSEEVSKDLTLVNETIVSESFEEFELAATKVKQRTVERLEAKFIVLQNAEKEKSEADRIEKERLEKEQKEREEKIAKEAAEAATRAAEEKAKQESEDKDKASREAVEAAERATLEAKLATEKAEREKREAADRAEKDKAAAIKYEQDRLLRKKQIEEEAEEKRQTNKRNRNKIHKEIDESIKKWSLTTKWTLNEEERKSLVDAMVEGKIKNITINY